VCGFYGVVPEGLDLLECGAGHWMFPNVSKELIAFIFNDQWSRFLISSLRIRKLNVRAPVHSFAFAGDTRVQPVLL